MSTAAARAGSQHDAKPLGRDAVVTSTLEAAANLFASRGPAATSIRDIAAAAGVNHGLIHRHLGSKDELVGAVLDYLGSQLADLLHGRAEPHVLQAGLDRQVRVIARATLDGYPPAQLQSHLPNVTALIESAKAHYGDDLQARLMVANAVALRMGWQLFYELLQEATGLNDVPKNTVSQSISDARDRVLGYHPDRSIVVRP